MNNEHVEATHKAVMAMDEATLRTALFHQMLNRRSLAKNRATDLLVLVVGLLDEVPEAREIKSDLVVAMTKLGQMA